MKSKENFLFKVSMANCKQINKSTYIITKNGKSITVKYFLPTKKTIGGWTYNYPYNDNYFDNKEDAFKAALEEL